MTEYVVNAPSQAAVETLAQQAGFWIVDQNNVGHIITNGVLASGGNWQMTEPTVVYEPTGATTTDAFGNPAPVMAALPGVWFRLRVNGLSDATLASIISATVAAGGTIYQQVTINGTLVWSVDGITPAPDYIANIGLIA